MSIFTIITIPGSPFARSVAMTLEEKGMAWRIVPVSPGALKTPEHLARHPFGRMPVVEHDGFSLYEAQAILRYIDRICPEPAMTPRDPKRAARMDQVMNINDWYLFQGCAAVIAFQRVVGPKLMGIVPDEAAIAAAMPRAQTAFMELSRLLGDQSFFAGEQVSLADMMLTPQIDFMAMTPEWDGLVAGHGNLSAWLKRMEQRASFQATTWDRVTAKAAA